MLRITALVSLVVALTTTLLFANASRVAAATTRTLNFQGRLLSSTGAVVADGHYNMQFKIYEGGTGTAAGNGGVGHKWTESYVNNNGTGGVEVRNGFFSINLGSRESFGDQVDWDQDVLWLSMNVAGTAAACTTFGSAPCVADGEMLPMKQIGATPYAINAGALQGKTADNFIQLAQGVQIDASNNTSSIHINKTGTAGSFLQLQSDGTDVFRIDSDGDIVFGSSADHYMGIAASGEDTAGRQLMIEAGHGGSGSGASGGTLVLQGGDAGGTDGDGGNLYIDAGAGTGTGADGEITIGTTNASSITIGSTYLGINQNINIGANNTAGSVSNVTVGAGAGAAGGSTTIQAKDEVGIATNGQRRATFSGDSNTLYVGNADGTGQATTANAFTIQGTSSTGNNTQGGNLTLQAGSALTGIANGGDLILSGGNGAGAGVSGLVVINTPTFQTASSDANCYTSGALVAGSCTFTSASVNSSAVLIAGFSTVDQTATMPDPAITTAGRIMYVTAANGSEDFTLRINTGDSTEQLIPMRQNTTATLVWNGSDWTSASAGSSTTLQDTYANTAQNAGSAELTLSGSGGGLTIRENNGDPVGGALLEVQNASAASVFTVNSNINEQASNPGAETDGGTATTFPSNTWFGFSGATVSRTTTGTNVATGSAAVSVVTSAATDHGVRNRLASTLPADTQFTVSFSAKLASGSFTDMSVFYAKDGSLLQDGPCLTGQTITTAGWTRVSCTFTTPSSGITVSNSILISQATATARTFYIDNLSVTATGSAAPNVQIGGGQTGGPATLFTLDKSASAPSASSSDALLGSMYYDTALGKVQCYEAEGWGNCGDAPDTFITLSPEYAGAVMNGSSNGTMTSDFCSDTLGVNDGSSSQPTICGTNETQNFYHWTSTDPATQTKSIYVTYKLRSSFKQFVTGSTSLMGRTDSADSSVSYQIYRNDGSGLTACGGSVAVSAGAQSTWQTATASSGSDPAACGFEAGDSIVFKINLGAKDNANAYVSDLGFVFNNN